MIRAKHKQLSQWFTETIGPETIGPGMNNVDERERLQYIEHSLCTFFLF